MGVIDAPMRPLDRSVFHDRSEDGFINNIYEQTERERNPCGRDHGLLLCQASGFQVARLRWRIARVRWMLIGNVCCSLSACFATPVWFDHCCQNGSAVSLSF